MMIAGAALIEVPVVGETLFMEGAWLMTQGIFGIEE